METLLLKIRIAILWIFLAVAMSASMILWFMGPGAIDEIMSGIAEGMQINTGLLLFFIIAIIFLIFYIGHLFRHLTLGPLPLEHLVICVLTILLPAIIFWYAWKWPKQKA